MKKVLDKLVQSGAINSYTIGVEPQYNGEPTDSKMCQTERITLNFANGGQLRISGISSGCLENISLICETNIP